MKKNVTALNIFIKNSNRITHVYSEPNYSTPLKNSNLFLRYPRKGGSVVWNVALKLEETKN